MQYVARLGIRKSLRGKCTLIDSGRTLELIEGACRLARYPFSKHWAKGIHALGLWKTLIPLAIRAPKLAPKYSTSEIQTRILDSGRVEMVLLDLLVK
jgi:hypothetical protein